MPIKQSLSILMILGFLLISSQMLRHPTSVIPTFVAKTRAPSAIPPGQLEIPLEKIVATKPLPSGISNEQIELVVPTYMAPTHDAKMVQDQLLDHSLTNFVQGRFFPPMEIIQRAQAVADSLKPRLTFGGQNGGIRHDLRFDFEAFQQKAKLTYSGYLNSRINYDAVKDDLDFSIWNQLGRQTQISIEHQSATDLSRLQLSWLWD